MHTSTMQLTVAELSDVMKTMIALLSDHHGRHGDAMAKQAMVDITQVSYIIAGASKHVL